MEQWQRVSHFDGAERVVHKCERCSFLETAGGGMLLFSVFAKGQLSIYKYLANIWGINIRHSVFEGTPHSFQLKVVWRLFASVHSFNVVEVMVLQLFPFQFESICHQAGLWGPRFWA